MRPLKLKRFIAHNLLILFSLVNVAYATQTIQIAAHLPPDSSDGNLMLIIDDIDSGIKTPVSIYLHAGQNLQTFQIQGDHYQIIPVKMVAPNQSFVPCSPTAIIDHHSLIITITGKILPNDINCAYRETTTLPQLYTPTVVTTPSTTPLNSTAKSGQTEMAKYLTSLSQDCKEGIFHTTTGAQKTEYNILGLKSGACEVSISTDEKQKPLLCQFSPEDVMYMASPEKISQAEAKQLVYSPSDLSARIMQARCHSL